MGQYHFESYAHRCRMLGKTPDEIRRRLRYDLLKTHNSLLRQNRKRREAEARWLAQQQAEDMAYAVRRCRHEIDPVSNVCINCGNTKLNIELAGVDV